MFESIDVITLFSILAICSILRDLKKKASFNQQLFYEMGALIYGNRLIRGLLLLAANWNTSSNLDLCHWPIWKWSKEYIG